MIWGLWVLFSLLICGYLGYRLLADQADQRIFLLGETTHGHHQIEMSCSSCHTSAFGGGEVLQNACVDCHGEALARVDDTHPRSKFTDPRNADRLANVDARQCVACHREHKPQMTGPMGVTVPMDVCYHCHEDIAEQRPSHQDMEFLTCSNSGCHNYHDNTALYEDFLLAHSDKPSILPNPQRLLRSQFNASAITLTATEQDAPEQWQADDTVLDEWQHSEHALAGINCSDCHASSDNEWDEKPDHTVCANCHSNEVAGFLKGMHGMRLAVGLSPMRPELANLAMQVDAHGRELSCTSCHSDHQFDTVTAAVDSCLECHADEHSLAYRDSPHYDLWRREQTGEGLPGSGVSCATCHLPRQNHLEQGAEVVRVQHNQNANLRPVEAMVRSVCMDCHGLGFALDALADPALLSNNFHGQPSTHVPSIEMSEERLRQQKNR